MTNPIDAIKQQLAQLQEQRASGALSQAQYDEGKATLERRLLDQVLATPATPMKPAIATASPPAVRRPSFQLLTGLGLLVLLLAAGGYVRTGHPELLQPGATARLAAAAAAQQAAQDGGGDEAGGHSVTPEQISAMTEKLAKHLADHPEDGEGWAMLARTYDMLQRNPQALQAYARALALRQDDSALLADYADSLALGNNSLAGEPMKLLQRALKIDPQNLKALALMGTSAFNDKDYAGAAKWWQKMVQIGPADNVFVRQIVPGLVQARKLAGLPPLPSLTGQASATSLAQPRTAAPSGAGPGAAVGASVSGTVTLSAALAKQVSPDDTLFVFARPADGSRMPLAILKRKVRDLPLHFTLDDSMAMSPASALSGASKVIVGARISKSGNAMPQSGDLQGLSDVVAVGSTSVQLEIRDVVSP